MLAMEPAAGRAVRHQAIGLRAKFMGGVCQVAGMRVVCSPLWVRTLERGEDLCCSELKGFGREQHSSGSVNMIELGLGCLAVGVSR